MDDMALWPRDRVQGLVTLGRRHGLADDAVLAGTGLRAGDLAGPSRPVTGGDEFTVIRNLTARIDASVPLPLEAGLDFHLSAVGTWGTALRTAPDLGSALAFGLTSDAAPSATVGLTSRIRGRDWVLGLEDRALPDDVRLFVTVRMMVFLAMTGLELLGERVPVSGVSVRGPEPAWSGALKDFYGAGIAWDAAETEVVHDAAVLSRPLAAAEPASFARAAAASERLVRRHRDGGTVTERVRTLLRDGASTTAVAERLTMSPRSLRRRLGAENTSLRALVLGERQERARAQLLAGSSVAEVAADLGYSEPAAFSRAFKAWTGRSPDAWRREHAG